MKTARVALALFVLASGTLNQTIGARQQSSRIDLTPRQWHEDLNFLAHELPSRHANAFHYTSKEKFEAAVADLGSRIDTLNADEVWVGFARIIALIGDAHTYLQLPDDKSLVHISFERFGDEYRVAAVARGQEKALGATLVKVENTPVERAVELTYQLFSQDENPSLSWRFISQSLAIGSQLHGLGIAPDRGTVHYTLRREDGQEFTLEAHPLPAANPDWAVPYTRQPLSRRNPQESFYCAYLSEARTLYCNVRSIRDLKSPAAAMLEQIGRDKPEKLALDLRQNSGGDFNEGLKHLVHPIRDLPSINRKGHLFVIIGPNTFSAAMANAAHFRDQTAAILVGLPIGEKPNEYAEPRNMTLPNSHLTVRYSTRYYKFVEAGDNIIRPDQEIVPTWEDYVAGRDPALEWILRVHD